MSNENEEIGIPALLEAGKKVVVTDRDTDRLIKALINAEKDGAEEDRARAFTSELYNYQYII